MFGTLTSQTVELFQVVQDISPKQPGCGGSRTLTHEQIGIVTNDLICQLQMPCIECVGVAITVLVLLPIYYLPLLLYIYY